MRTLTIPRDRRTVVATGAATGLFGSLLLAVPAVADPPRKTSRSTVTVVAKDLANPRHLVVDRRGDVYVAEAGRGALDPKKGPCVRAVNPETNEKTSFCYGPTSAITRIRGASTKRVVTGLPSVAEPSGQNAGGVSDLTEPVDGRAVGVVNLGGDPAKRKANLPAPAVDSAGHLLTLNVKDDRFRVRTDVAAFETRSNPDAKDPQSALDSNPYAVAADGSRGAVVVADAGGNDLLSVDRSGHISLLAVFRARMVPAPAALKLPVGAKIPMQAVPDSVVKGPDGAWYVGELTGFPFAKGAARVWKVMPGHKPTVVASGFTNIIDLGFDRRGRLLVLEIATNGLLDPASPGALWMVGKHGSKKLVTRELTAPGGLAVSGNDAYLTTSSTSPTSGKVVKLRLPS